MNGKIFLRKTDKISKDGKPIFNICGKVILNQIDDIVIEQNKIYSVSSVMINTEDTTKTVSQYTPEECVLSGIKL